MAIQDEATGMNIRAGHWTLIALLAGVSTDAMAAAPFCLVYGGGTNCIYWDYSYCQQAARSQGGACVANPQQMQPQVVQPAPSPAPIVIPQYRSFDNGAAFNQGFQDGQRQRMEREEHEARMALMRAQTNAVESRPTEQPIASWDDVANAMEAYDGKRRVIYACTLDGVTRQTEIPSRGCVVIGFGDSVTPK